eukprot:5718879-Pyramimonas_sp.AAC.1
MHVQRDVIAGMMLQQRLCFLKSNALIAMTRARVQQPLFQDASLPLLGQRCELMLCGGRRNISRQPKSPSRSHWG